MVFEDFKAKPSVVVVFTGSGKGKTSASLGLACRALGAGHKVAYIQFIKHWVVSEHKFIAKIQPLFKDQLYFYKGGIGFFDAGELSAKGISKSEHIKKAQATYKKALSCASSGKYNLVICDEINNAVHDGLLSTTQLADLIATKSPLTSLCLTGRNFPKDLIERCDIVTNMAKLKHHFDDKFLANNGIDY